MPDIFSKAMRSGIMAAIRSQGNKATELRLIRVFRTHGITGWRRGCTIRGQKTEGRGRTKRFSVRPDFVFPKLKTAVFVDGCFWHGCPRHATQPKANAAFWREKITTNKARDRKVNRLLRALGWKVIRVWQHELRLKNETRLLSRLAVVRGTKSGRAQMAAPRGAAPKG